MYASRFAPTGIMILLLIALCSIHHSAVQALDFYIQDVEITYLNEEYIDPDESMVYLQAENDTFNTIVSEFKLLKELPADTTCRFSMWINSMGEYSQSGGLDITLGFCETLDEPVLMGKLMKVLGVERDTCPPQPGVYGNPSYFPPTDLMPDALPGDKYLVKIEVKEPDSPILSIDVYVNLS